MIPQVAEKLTVRHRHDELPRRDAADLTEKRRRILDVLEHVETKRSVENTVRKRQRFAVRPVVRQAAPPGVVP